MPWIIDPTLYNRIANSDPTLTELTFGMGGTNFFGAATNMEIIGGRVPGYGGTGQHTRSSVQKELSHAFFYNSNLLFSCLFKEEEKLVQVRYKGGTVPKSHGYQLTQIAERKGCGFEELAEALEKNTSIRTIDLTADGVTTKIQDDRDVRVILSAVRKHTTLTSLTLGTASLGAEGFNVLCSILRNNSPPLKFLSINSSDVIKDKGRLQLILDMVTLNNTLEMIQIQYPSGSSYDYIKTDAQWRSGSSNTIKKIGSHSETDIERLINQIREVVRNKVAARQAPANNDSNTVADLKEIVAQQQQQIQMLMQAMQLQNSGKAPTPGAQSSFSPPSS